MNSQPEIHSKSKMTAFPVWLRVVVWLSIVFLTMSVIAGMFLY